MNTFYANENPRGLNTAREVVYGDQYERRESPESIRTVYAADSYDSYNRNNQTAPRRIKTGFGD